MASIVWLLRMRPSLLCGVGITTKVVTAFTLVYFILLVNTLAGSKNVDNDILSIARLMGATRRTLLWKVIFPPGPERLWSSSVYLPLGDADSAGRFLVAAPNHGRELLRLRDQVSSGRQ